MTQNLLLMTLALWDIESECVVTIHYNSEKFNEIRERIPKPSLKLGTIFIMMLLVLIFVDPIVVIILIIKRKKNIG